MSREELIDLVERIQAALGNEAEISAWVAELQSAVPDPNIVNYVYWPDRPMSAAEIVDRAMEYKPIVST